MDCVGSFISFVLGSISYCKLAEIILNAFFFPAFGSARHYLINGFRVSEKCIWPKWLVTGDAPEERSNLYESNGLQAKGCSYGKAILALVQRRLGKNEHIFHRNSNQRLLRTQVTNRAVRRSLAEWQRRKYRKLSPHDVHNKNRYRMK